MRERRFIVCSDNHGDMQDEKAVKAFLAFAKDWNADIRVHAGDGFDIRAFRKGASEEDQCGSLEEDVAAGLDFIRRFKPNHFLRGNHDERLWDGVAHHKAERAALCFRLCKEIEDALGFRSVPYNKRTGVLRFGHLSIVHGYHTGINAAKRAAECYGNVLCGHVHTVDHYSIPYAHGRTMGRAIGCLCRLEQDYNRAQANTLRQAHGWAYGFLYGDGTFKVVQAEEINGRWVLPDSFKEYK